MRGGDVFEPLAPNQFEGNVISVGPHEANRLIELVRAFHEESGHAVSREHVEAIRQLCADSTLGQAWLLAVGDRDVGYALAYLRHSIDHGGRIAVLDDLWVTVSRRGQGLGARLLKAVCEDLRAVGARAVLLEVDPANQSRDLSVFAVRLYPHWNCLLRQGPFGLLKVSV